MNLESGYGVIKAAALDFLDDKAMTPAASLASLIVLLLWVYYAALIFFFGAELTQVLPGPAAAGWRRREHAEVVPEAERREEHAETSVRG